MSDQRVFGCDPELGVFEKGTNNIVPPASLIRDYNFDFTLNSRGKRTLLTTDRGLVIEDGAAIELNPNPGTPEEVVDNVSSLIKQFDTLLKSRVKETLVVDKTRVHGLFDTSKYWDGQDENFRDCVRAGCDPDEVPGIYEMLKLDKSVGEVDLSNNPDRFFGGHAHCQNMSSNSDIYINNRDTATVVFDFLVGTANVFLVGRLPNVIKDEKLRLSVYGRPGRFRIQKYSDKINGIEYRPLSNQWIINSRTSTHKVFNLLNTACNVVEWGLSTVFVDQLYDKIPLLWSSLKTYNIEKCRDLFNDAQALLVEIGITSLDDAGV